MAFERSRAVLAKAGFTFVTPDIGAPDAHIVDILIAERGRQLTNHPAWPLLRPFLHKVLHYRRAVRMADEIAPLSGLQALDYVSRLLDLSLTISGSRHVPRKGGFVMVANHPTGIADGVAVFDALKDIRRDLAIFTNRDAIRVNRRLGDVLIPVEWRDSHKSTAKSRETLKSTHRAVGENRAMVLFPAGRIAYWADGRLNERPWQTSAVALARKYGLPVLPANVTARNSWLFYWLAGWNTELRDMTVFHELLNKRKQPFSVTFGPLIDPAVLEGDPSEVTTALQDYCAQDLKRDPLQPFVAPA